MNILFIIPPSRRFVYLKTMVKAATPSYPNYTAALLSADIDQLKQGHKISLIDLDLERNVEAALNKKLEESKPDVVCMSSNTPAYPHVEAIAKFIKEKSPETKIILGGVHITSLPEEAIKNDFVDVVCVGEGDITIQEIIQNLPDKMERVAGIFYKKDGRIFKNPGRDLMLDLDILPFPRWDLFDLSKYKHSKLSAKMNPVGHVETSRGCPFNCVFCNKNTFGTFYRPKSPERVIDDIKYSLASGFKEIHILDDNFTQDIERAKQVCRLIVKNNLRFPWNLISGIRVDRVDKEFFKLAKQAGCYQTAFGIESGDQEILDRIGKRTNLKMIRDSVKMANQAGIKTFGFFVLALPGDTEESMQKTIDFAKSLDLTVAKFAICTPYPGTRFFIELDKESRIKSKNWADYISHGLGQKLYDHPSLSWETIEKYYKKSYRAFYLNPKYILKRIKYGFEEKTLLSDIKAFFGTRW